MRFARYNIFTEKTAASLESLDRARKTYLVFIESIICRRCV